MAFRRVFRTLSRLRGRDTHLGGSELSHAQFELLDRARRARRAAGRGAGARRAPGAGNGHADARPSRRVRPCRTGSLGDRPAGGGLATDGQGRRKIEAKRKAWQSRWEAGARRSRDRRSACRHACARASRHGLRGRPCGGGSRCVPVGRSSRSEERAGAPETPRETPRFLCYSRASLRGWSSRASMPTERTDQDGDLEQITTRTGPDQTSSARGPEGPIFLLENSQSQFQPGAQTRRDPTHTTPHDHSHLSHAT